MTAEELAAMTPEQKRIRIAELCGWRECERCTRNLKPKSDGVEARGLDPQGDHTGGWKEYALLPDYLNDLNAMHEAERAVAHSFLPYAEAVASVMRLPTISIMLLRATAEQRADAFLLTLG